jgi:hypothetical protein
MNMGGLYKRQGNETIKNFVKVENIDSVLEKVEKLGGRIMMPKEMIPGVGLVSMVQDTKRKCHRYLEAGYPGFVRLLCRSVCFKIPVKLPADYFILAVTIFPAGSGSEPACSGNRALRIRCNGIGTDPLPEVRDDRKWISADNDLYRR